MTKPQFGKRLGFAAIMAVAFAAPVGRSRRSQAREAEPAPPKAGKLINAGDVLSGELNAMKTRGGKHGKRVATYQLTSEPRRLAAAERALQSGDRPGNLPAHHLERRAGRPAEGFYRQGNLGEGR